MVSIFMAMLSWLPGPLWVIAYAVVSLFFIFTLLHLVRFILDLIPFL